MDSTEVAIDSTKVKKVDAIKLNWVPNYKEALKRAKKEKKAVLIYFTGSDWCEPCKVLDRDLFHTEKFKTLSDNDLVLLEVDSPRRQDLLSQDKISENLYLKRKFKIKSFPALIILNYRGRKIAEKRGYILTEYYYPFIQSAIYK
ncbi:hypothetical protein BTO18_01205 [Polaribacter porphyrae]|uniref:Thioredoxin domain-containing protein n=1 Tax=Polaribacter porphyrae TaxID=1137780 RepID=A0A2S7WTC5_9FLAO|nr:hypothetical protein BTO18_01205 [Polaribacter porphyrae]